MGEAQALVAPKMAPWAAAAGRHQEESASDLEGGDSGYHQEHFTQPPPPPPRKPAPAKEEKKKTAQVCTAQQLDWWTLVLKEFTKMVLKLACCQICCGAQECWSDAFLV